ncbi:MAG: AI-2E family transporter [Planctomycetota bacterium]
MKISNRRKWQIGLITLVSIAALVLMYNVRSVLNPFLLGLVLAYILNPLITWMEKKGAPRKSSVVLIFVLLLTIFIAASVIIVPFAAEETKSWYTAFMGEPFEDLNKNAKFDRVSEGATWIDANGNGEFDKGYIAKLRDKLIELKEGEDGANSIITRFVSKEQYQKIVRNATVGIKDNLNSIVSSVRKFAGNAISQLFASAGWVWNLAFLIVLTPIYMGFLLYSMDSGWKKFTSYVPAAVKPKFLDIIHKIDIVIGAFFRGRLLVCLSIGIFTAIGFAIFNVKFGIILGLIIGIASFIPFLNIVPFILVLLICWIDGMGLGSFAAVVIVYGLGQGIDPLMMTLVMGKELELHPVTILLSMFICASLLGFFGMLLAVPIVAVSKILFAEFVLPHLKELAEDEAV